MYIKFCRTYENGDANPKWSDESKTPQASDIYRRVQVYRGLSVFLSILSLILAVAVIILCIKLETRTFCLEKEVEKVPCPQVCSAEKCRMLYPNEPTKGQPCSLCSPGWQRFENSCFYLSRDYRSWSDSREACRQRGGDLAVVDSERMQEFLTKKGNLMYWIGLRRAKTQEWVWVNNATLGDSYWSQSVKLGDCGFLIGGDSHRSSWSSSSCWSKSAYICQKEATKMLAM